VKPVARRIRPLADIGPALLSVEKPSRYLGGEFGSICKEEESLLSFALCFPDLYEIGMSNNAIRILYSGLNALPGVRAERVFAPAPDFEALLARLGLPLYTLETGMALSDLDILGFSIGYELAATSVLAVLASGHVPLLASDRGELDPIVIAGGPAISNPHPFAAFIDAAFIGEAEGSFYALAGELASMKLSGVGRAELLSKISEHEAIWIPAGRGGRRGKAVRAIFGGFGTSLASTAFPVPTVKVVQDHGTVEIMRGCPNGCRFCHAGFYYRPQRLKPYEIIRLEVEELVSRGGYREITLSSLSSGDYPRIEELLDCLNSEWAGKKVSFQLPSLKINSFTLPLLQKLSEVRKSGLTFAVETPVDSWQLCVNKDVSFDKTIAILEEARKAGFKQAKFYFMIGLPVPGRGLGEAQAILDFFDRLRARVNIQINVNVGTFVPKPHTPFQWSAQLSEEDSMGVIEVLKAGLRKHRNIKLSYHSPFLSKLEGIISRGDDRVGELILSAFRKGARLDAWEEHFDRKLWREVLDTAACSTAISGDIARDRDHTDTLAWDDIGIRVSKASLWREFEKSQIPEATSACTENCKHPCGACDDAISLDTSIAPPNSPRSRLVPATEKPAGRLVFRFSKKNVASYFQHLSVIDAFERAILISDLPAAYSEGFNPMPRLELSQPIPIAVESCFELASILVAESVDASACMISFNECLPQGLRIEEARYYGQIEGRKHRSIASLEWGSTYRLFAPSSLNTDGLISALMSETGKREVPHTKIIPVDDASIDFMLPTPQKKEQGLWRILESLSGADSPQALFRPLRLDTWAVDPAGLPIPFFEALNDCN
jgi:radical SAM superfamily enzyme YgiQ (UPF0313 family)